MVNFAELKAKAEKAKDASVIKVTNTRDRYISAPSSKVNWDPNWKRAPPPRPGYPSGAAPPPPPPLRSRPDVIASGGDADGPPAVSRASRPAGDAPAPLAYMPPPPPTRAASAYPPGHSHRASVTPQDTVEEGIDWANLSLEDKEAFFGWLDEFFSRYLGVELGPRRKEGSAAPSLVSGALSGHRLPSTRIPPMVNIATRPQV